MASKRISSIFSLSSNYSDRTTTSTQSREPSSTHPSRPAKAQSVASLAAKSTPNLRPTNDLQNLHNTQSSGLTPPHDPTVLPRIEDNHFLLQPPQTLQPNPLRSNHPGGSRPASVGAFPEKRAGENALSVNTQDLLTPLPPATGSPVGSRPASRASGIRLSVGSRPTSRPPSRAGSPVKSRPQTPTADRKLSKRRSWIPGRARGLSQSEGQPAQMPNLQAWLVTPQEKQLYDTTPLASFDKVPDLWDENGDTFVYLHSREHGRGPSFKIDSSLFSSSKKLARAAHGVTHSKLERDPNGIQNRSLSERSQHLIVNQSSRPGSPASSQQGTSSKGSSKGSRSISDFLDEAPVKKDVHLCLPMPLKVDLSNPTARPAAEDIETLLTIRNMFAFLAGKNVVATPKQSSLFTIFLKIADVMQRYEFTNLDGSTLGEEASGSFSRVIEDYKLADVRSSREKTLEAILLGERMRSWTLYNEGFVHAVGKYDDVVGLKSSKYGLISDNTRKRLERAHLDLYARLRNIQVRLDDFDFPSIFAGTANSTSTSESKVIRFKDWKAAYASMRRHVLSLYKQKYGAWPPKARSKKNDFEESGLNRLLMLDVYQDFSDLYDVLVDRSNCTTRSADVQSQAGTEESNTPRVGALRKILDEYDRSIPPVQPAVPFDIPRLPSLTDARRGFDKLDPKKQKKENAKKLQDDEINNALMQSYNRDSVKSTPFLEAFMAYERRSAHGKSMEEIADLRDGQWLFMYAVLQALPLVVVDAPNVQWNKGVEYFLCEVPRGSPPWVQENHTQKQRWYGVDGGAGMVSLPADIVEHGVDGIYRRSHCWQAADRWAGFSYTLGAVAQHPPPNDFLLPPTVPSQPCSRSGSPATSHRRRLSTSGGLEQLPLPPGVVPTGSRPASPYDPSKTFGAILASQNNDAGKKKKK